jgi:putative intracellular protease/amidase
MDAPRLIRRGKVRCGGVVKFPHDSGIGKLRRDDSSYSKPSTTTVLGLVFLSQRPKLNFSSQIPSMQPKLIGVVTFDGFETLDVYGPLGLLVSAAIGNPYSAVLIGPPNPRSPNTVHTSSNLPTYTEHTLQWPTKEKYDVLLIPGGVGNRPLLKDSAYLELLRKNVEAVINDGGTILCVCTGSVLVAATGMLDGKQATTNKRAYDALTPLYSRVHWKRAARWVEDGQIISSSGVSAGMVLQVQTGS